MSQNQFAQSQPQPTKRNPSNRSRTEALKPRNKPKSRSKRADQRQLFNRSTTQPGSNRQQTMPLQSLDQAIQRSFNPNEPLRQFGSALPNNPYQRQPLLNEHTRTPIFGSALSNSQNQRNLSIFATPISKKSKSHDRPNINRIRRRPLIHSETNSNRSADDNQILTADNGQFGQEAFQPQTQLQRLTPNQRLLQPDFPFPILLKRAISNINHRATVKKMKVSILALKPESFGYTLVSENLNCNPNEDSLQISYKVQCSECIMDQIENCDHEVVRSNDLAQKQRRKSLTSQKLKHGFPNHKQHMKQDHQKLGHSIQKKEESATRLDCTNDTNDKWPNRQS